MKILKLRFKNLNSLVGEWTIDFSDKRFIDDGIFAITGPTGAGKSTILDAISLALYAQTPRLGKITKSSNEIMSKGTGECFSEVLFEVNGKQYLTHWYQHRSRRKANGELQNPKHEISKNGKILEDNLRKVPTKVEDICGLDFDKMRRSMLLAQGSFDVFLKANANERAPLLEEITGTQIYSQISIEVHKKKSEIKGKTELLEERLQGIELLDKEQELQLNQELKNLTLQNIEIDKTLKESNTILQKFQSKQNIENELKNHYQEFENLTKQIAEFEPKKEDILKIKKALAIENSYTKLSDLNNKNATKSKLLSECKLDFEKIKKELSSASDNKDLNSRKLKELKSTLEQKKPLFEEIKREDIDIKHKAKSLKELQSELSKKEQTLNDINSTIDRENGALKSKTQTLKELKEQEKQNSKDEKLSQDISLIENNLNRLNSSKNVLEELNKELNNDKNIATQKQKELEKIKSEISIFESKEKDLQNRLSNEQEQLNKLLQNGDIIKIQEQINTLNTKKETIKELLISIKQGQDYKKEISQIDANLRELNKSLSNIDIKISVIKKDITPLKEQKNLLDENMLLLKEVQSLAQYRNALEDGKECPLCGSKEHPFAKGNIPKIDEKKEQLKKLKADIETLEKELNIATIHRAKIEQNIELNKENIEKLEKLFAHLDSEFKLKLLELNLSKDKVSIKDLKEQEHNLQEKITQLNGHTKAIEKQREVAKDIETKYRQQKEKFDNLLKSHTKEQQNLELLNEKMNAKNRQIAEAQSEISTLNQELTKSLNFYNIDINQSNIILKLQQRVRKYQDILSGIQSNELEIAKLNNSLKAHTEQQKSAIDEVANLKLSVDNLQTILTKLKEQRVAKFGDKDPQKEERELEVSIKTLESELAKIESIYLQNKSIFDKKESQIESLNRELKSLQIEIDSAKQKFEKNLKEQGFNDENSFLNVLKEKNSLQELENMQTKLKEQNERLKALLKDKEAKLQEIEASLKDIDKSKIEDKININEQNRDKLLQEIGRIKEKLEINKKSNEKFSKSLAELNLAKQELKKWEQLHELIGSSDGKKFRNFAQGLTFEIMINFANEILEKMNDRYYLIRNQTSPLELDVIDAYQAGEIRSVKNLSGGESFIVSLSLAIGLSKMVSGKVQVDSLFLDEGFGTLDDDAMEVALSTLSTLQSEGKIIGVISHINTIKERIFNQIQLTPKSNGTSVMSGVGVGE